MSRSREVNWRDDKWLAILVIVLWSVGRIVNPTLHAFERAAISPGAITIGASAIYVLLHLFVLAFTAMLMYRSFKRHGWEMQGAIMWQFILYVYVGITVLFSLYFILYQLGVLPVSLQDLLPYPFNINQVSQ